MLDEVLVSRGNCGDEGAIGKIGDVGDAAVALLLGRSGVLGGAEGVGSGTFEAGPFELLAASVEEAVGDCLLDHWPNGDERP